MPPISVYKIASISLTAFLVILSYYSLVPLLKKKRPVEEEDEDEEEIECIKIEKDNKVYLLDEKTNIIYDFNYPHSEIGRLENDTNTYLPSKLGLSEIERKLVLVLGGVSHTSKPDYSLNLIYKRFEERPLDSTLDVVVVDPEPWQYIPLGRVKHHQMRLENYLVGDRLDRLLSEYKTIAVIDDLFFKDHRMRQAVINQEAWRTLALALEKHTDTCSWWVIKHPNCLQIPKLVRMSGNILLTNAMQRSGIPGQLLSLDPNLFINVWNPLLRIEIDWQVIEHPFRELLHLLI